MFLVRLVLTYQPRSRNDCLLLLHLLSGAGQLKETIFSASVNNQHQSCWAGCVVLQMSSASHDHITEHSSGCHNTALKQVGVIRQICPMKIYQYPFILVAS